MAVARKQLVLDAIQSIDAETQSGGVVLQLTRFARHFGLENPYISQFAPPGKIPGTNFLHITSWPKELCDRRRALDPAKNDAVVRTAIRKRSPMAWQEAYAGASDIGKQLMDMSRDYNLADGYMFPLEALGGGLGGVSYSTTNPSLSDDELGAVEIVSLTAFHKLEGLLGYFPNREAAILSKREAEIAMLIAQGHTDADIGNILGIKQDTVAKTIKNARRKLGANNRAHLVFLAAQKNQFFV